MGIRRFGTFEGVFTPTILTIIGVILYLRLGWVVGQLGLLKALGIILLAHVATLTTGLALSSLATNTRIGAGGFYSLISKTLGLEAGGAIGIPLYISQSLSIALYVVGFTEAWLLLFPEHLPFYTMTIVFLFIFALTYGSAKIAMKFQFLVMGAIALSLISFIMGVFLESEAISWTSEVKSDIGYWQVFAIFFPAVTGISAGAALSGDLSDPKKSLPLGIMIAIMTGLMIYLGMAVLLAMSGTGDTLKNNQMIMVDKAYFPSLVIAGIMGATFSSALSSFLAASRILMALGIDHLVPMGKLVSTRSPRGEPRIATLITACIAYLCLVSLKLDGIAALLTMFFLITYATINFAVFIEKAVGMPSFRPSFKVPQWVPLLGGIGCTVIMFLINLYLAALAVAMILIVYGLQLRRNLHNEWGDVRSGFFTLIAEWAAKTAAKLPSGVKNWKPNFLVPIENPHTFQIERGFIRDLVFPKGTVRLFSVQTTEKTLEERIQMALKPFFKKKIESKKKLSQNLLQKRNKALEALIEPFKREGIFAAYRVVESNHFLESFSVVTQILQGMFFPPNIIFLTMGREHKKDHLLMELIGISIRAKLGVMIYAKKDTSLKENLKDLNLWLREGSPNLYLSILAAMLLIRNWNGVIRLISVVDAKEKIEKRKEHLRRVIKTGRLPENTDILVFVGSFDKIFSAAPAARINLFGAANPIDFEAMHAMVELSKTPCLFIKESGSEPITL